MTSFKLHLQNKYYLKLAPLGVCWRYFYIYIEINIPMSFYWPKIYKLVSEIELEILPLNVITEISLPYPELPTRAIAPVLRSELRIADIKIKPLLWAQNPNCYDDAVGNLLQNNFVTSLNSESSHVSTISCNLCNKIYCSEGFSSNRTPFERGKGNIAIILIFLPPRTNCE